VFDGPSGRLPEKEEEELPEFLQLKKTNRTP